MRNKIYYLCDFHLSCEYISRYSEKHIKLYIAEVVILLNTYFNLQEQKQLKMDYFDGEKFNSIAEGNLPDDISFDGLDEQKLNDFFDKISIMDISDLEKWEKMGKN